MTTAAPAATRRTLPPLIAEAITTIQGWPTSKEDYDATTSRSSTKMFYAPLERMKHIRNNSTLYQYPNCCTYYLANNVLEIVQSLQQGSPSGNNNNNDTSATAAAAQQQKHHYYARIATALILLGHGLLDEAHALVAPLSWPGELPYSAGPSVPTTGMVLTLASYTHCLIHRREGPHPSEFDQSGLGNSNYWAGMALRSDDDDALRLVRRQIRQEIWDVATDVDGSTHDVAKKWVREKVIGAGTSDAAFDLDRWDPRILNELLQQHAGVVVDVHQQQLRPNDEMQLLRSFAEKAALVELRILLNTALEQLGY